jgi:hypothetical protein
LAMTRQRRVLRVLLLIMFLAIGFMVFVFIMSEGAAAPDSPRPTAVPPATQ